MHIQAITSFTGKTRRYDPETENLYMRKPDRKKGHGKGKPQGDQFVPRAKREQGASLGMDPLELIQIKVACGERLTPEEQSLYDLVMSDMSGMY